MLLVFDVGNTNMVLGVYEGTELKKHWRINTDKCPVFRCHQNDNE